MSNLTKTVCLLLISLGCLLIFNQLHEKNCFEKQSRLENVQCNLMNIKEDEPTLVKFIQEAKLKLPSPTDLDYNLNGKPLGGQIGQVDIVLQYFKNKTNGFFIEAGAHDGELLSNTLQLEKDFHWTGLLVEPNSISYQNLETKNRKAFAINACISTSSHPDVVDFKVHGMGSTVIKDLDRVKNINENEKVECYPLYSMLLAIGQTKVDFFSLDIEGAEEFVLRSIPWDKIDIDLVNIEVNHSDEEEIRKIMKNAGYKVHKELYELDKDGNQKPNFQDIMFSKHS